MKTKNTINTSWMKKFFCFLLAFAMIFSNVTIAQAETSTETITYPAVLEYNISDGSFALTENSRLVIISTNLSLQNETLENDLKLLSSEFNKVGLTDNSMNIIYGSETTAAAGDIVVELLEASDDISPEAYTITIGETAKVSATGEAGIFYGVRTIQKALLLNGGKMNCGTINDEPAVEVRGFHLDAARKFFTKDWILAQIKDLSYQNFNTIQFHFSENEGYRLESSTLEAIEGWRYPSNGYLTKEDMLEIIAECQKYHIELVPSLDSPGHMSYVLNYLPDDWDCSSIWSESTDYRSVQTFNIFEKQECKDFLKDLFAEYAEFFSEAGCKHFNIGGDEFLNQFGRMTDEQYILVMDYFNEISALVKEYGMTPRAWNDGLMYGDYTGYTLDPDIEICYWAGPAGTATVKKFTDNGNKVINMADSMMYYVLGSWWMSAANPAGDRVFKDWDPGKLPSSADHGAQTMTYPYDDSLLGASFAVWCDTPSMLTQDQIANNIFMRTRATAQKCWNPTITFDYSSLESRCNTLGRAPGYDGSALPASGEVVYEGEFGTLTVRYVDTDGNILKAEKTTYGLLDDPYTVAAEDIYGYRFVSMDKDAEGTYTTDEIVVTLTYELYTDKTALTEAVASEQAENDYIPATYAVYKEALAAAKALIADDKATQSAVDAALEALTQAETSLVGLDRVALYLELEYPVSEAGYTTATYNEYKAAMAAGQNVLTNADATAEEVQAATDAIAAKKSALAVPTDMITVSANKGFYSGYVDYTYGSWPASNMLDGNPETKAWTDDAQTIGDYFLFTFTKPVKLNSFTIQFTDSNDYIYGADVEISADNSNWEKIGTIDNTTNPQLNLTFDAEGATVQYVKITITKTVNNWTQINEVTFDYEAEETDNSSLEAAIADVKDLTETDYTVASWTVFAAALANAEEVLADTGATTGEINAAITALEACTDALVDASATPVPEEVCKVFPDVKHGAWYETSVQYVYDKGLMTGSNGLFKPGDEVSRAQFVTTLYRLAGSPAVTDDSACEEFPDVLEGKYYTDPVCWAYANGITTGSNGVFNTNGKLSRQQLATFLYRFAEYMDCDVTAEGDYSDMLNADQVAGYAEKAMKWAVGAGIISGSQKTDATGATVFDLNPKGNTTRAQLAAILERFCEGNNL